MMRLRNVASLFLLALVAAPSNTFAQQPLDEPRPNEWIVGVFPCSKKGDPRPELKDGMPITKELIEAYTNPKFDREIMVFVHNTCDGRPPPTGAYACRVTYIKNGAMETLWRANNDREYCYPRAEALAKELEDAGFYCMPTDAQNECETDEFGLVQEEAANENGGANEEIVVTVDRIDFSSLPAADERELELNEYFEDIMPPDLVRPMVLAMDESFSVMDLGHGPLLSPGIGEYMRFDNQPIAYSVTEQWGLTVIEANFEHGTIATAVFFGFKHEAPYDNPAHNV